MKKFMLIFIMIALFVSGCASQEVEPIKIGWIGALSGDVASIGVANIRGIEIAVDEINANGGIEGRPVKLIIEDDQFDERLARSAFHKIVSVNDVDVVMSMSYGAIIGLADEAERQDVVIVDSMDSSEELASAGDYVFAIGVYNEGIGYAVAEHAAEIGAKEAGIIFNNADPFITLVKDSFKEKFEEKGGKVVVEEAYLPEAADFRAQMAKIKAAEVPVLFIIGWDESGIAVRQAKQLGVEAKILGIDTFASEAFQRNAGEAAEGVAFAFFRAAESPEIEGFVQKFENKFNQEPDQIMFSVIGHDAAKVIAEAMKQAIAEGKEPRGAALKDAMHNAKDYNGLAGNLSIDPDGAVRSIREEMFQLQKGEIVKI
ncbi:ABC transporter substrate-binding protein [Candidatus Woesearchaeota archaeon]|nr:ABC transporter substrate-binding protein [Candidatus Woesearchaeota archaeon]MBW3018485.1 ABC transporter substrate-binding protein [Candidatus Woesearchaeota archaeon]